MRILEVGGGHNACRSIRNGGIVGGRVSDRHPVKCTTNWEVRGDPVSPVPQRQDVPDFSITWGLLLMPVEARVIGPSFIYLSKPLVFGSEERTP